MIAHSQKWRSSEHSNPYSLTDLYDHLFGISTRVDLLGPRLCIYPLIICLCSARLLSRKADCSATSSAWKSLHPHMPATLGIFQLSNVCHPTISSSIALFFFCLQSFPASGSFPMSWLFASDGPRTGASASVLPMNIQGWFPLRLIGLASLLSRGLSRVFSSLHWINGHEFRPTPEDSEGEGSLECCSP